MTNPFFVYTATFVTAVLLYQFRWSTLYPPLSKGLVLFLAFTILVALLWGAVVQHYGLIQVPRHPQSTGNSLAIGIILTTTLFEIALNRQFPLLLVLTDAIPNQKAFVDDYGIPLLHPLLLSFSAFYAVHLFHQALSHQVGPKLWLMTLALAPALMSWSRGTLAIVFISCLFTFIQHVTATFRLRARHVLAVGIVSLLGLYVFGLSGNVRTQDPRYILRIGGASNSFTESIVPSPFFWGYLYLSSPLANLQKTELDARRTEMVGSMATLFFFDIVPNFVGKYFIVPLGLEEPERHLISSPLTASTIYARPYNISGWPGAILVYIYLVLFVNTTLVLVRGSKYGSVGVAFLNTTMLLSGFSNSLVFSGTILPIIFAVVFSISVRYRDRRKHIRGGVEA